MREVRDWLSSYLKYVEKTEPPILFHTWTAVSVIAACLERRVYLPWGMSSTIYPNHYIVLLGPSAHSRKGEAISLGRELIKETTTTTVSESITREALIKKFGQDSTKVMFKDNTTGEFVHQSALYEIAEELTVFLGQKDIKFLGDLTNWYDSRPDWAYETKHFGTDDVEGMCFNLLGGTAPDWLVSILPREAIGGGWTSRTIFVVEEMKFQSAADPREMSIDEELKGLLIADLQHIRTVSGTMTFADDALETYIKWYEQMDRDLKAGKPPVHDPALVGYIGRRATHLRKLAMVLSVSRGDDLTITLKDFKRALALLIQTESKMHKAFTGLGSAKFHTATMAI